MSKNPIEDRNQIWIDDCIDDEDRALNPLSRFLRHNAIHARTTRMVLDEFVALSVLNVVGGNQTRSEITLFDGT